MRGRLRRVTPLVAALLMTWPHTAVARPVRPGTPNSAATATAPTSRPDPPAIPAHGSPPAMRMKASATTIPVSSAARPKRSTPVRIPELLSNPQVQRWLRLSQVAKSSTGTSMESMGVPVGATWNLNTGPAASSPVSRLVTRTFQYSFAPPAHRGDGR